MNVNVLMRLKKRVCFGGGGCERGHEREDGR